MKKFLSTAVLFLFVSALAMSISAGAVTLTDIEGHWAKEYIRYGVENGYINGYLDNTFKPDNTVTRAEFSKMLNTAVGIKSTEDVKFSDVKSSDWFYNDVRKAVYAGYVSGYTDGTFLPNKVITRDEAAVILYRITLPSDIKGSLEKFADKDDIDTWASDAVAEIAAKGYIRGDEQSRFLPKTGLTRGAAAKLIYQFVTNENIHNGDVTVTNGSSTFSDVLFTDNVTVDKSSEALELMLDNCRILGKLVVNGTDTYAQISNTVVNALENNAGGNTVLETSNNSEIAAAVINTPASLTGDGYDDVVLSGSSLSSGIVTFDGEFDLVEAESNAIVKINDGSITKLDVNKQINLIIQSGDIAELNVNAEAKNAVITLSPNTVVDTANSYAICSFMGTGKIGTAYSSVAGVTYETAPEETTGTKPAQDEDENGNGLLASPTVTPSSGKTGVSVGTSIAVQFDEDIFDLDGNIPSTSYIKSNVSLRKTSAAGNEVSFTASVNTTKKFTIYPTSDLIEDTKYYLVINADAFRNEDGDTNQKITSYFTTAESAGTNTSTSGSVTFSPASGSTGTDLDGSIKLTFSGAMHRPNGNALTSAYIQSNVIELHKSSASGALVDFTAEINSTKKVITITPENYLESNTKYYVVILGNSIANSDGAALSKTTAYFTTANSLLAQIEPDNATTGVSTVPEITITFSEPVTRSSGTSVTSSYLMSTVLELHKSTASGTAVDFTATISSDKKTITMTPDSELAKSTKYYVILNDGTLKGSGGAVNEKSSVYFTTAANMAPVVSPLAGKSGISTSSEITVSFGEALYTTSSSSTRKEVTADYVKENNVVLLRKSTTTGTIIDCDITVDNTTGTITLKPKSELIADLKYYIVVKTKTVYNESGKYNSSSSTYFTTAEVLSPEFSPADGDDGVDVASKPEVIFNEPVYRANGSALTASYVASNVLELHKTNEDGALVDFSVTLSTDKQTFIIKPDDNLEGETDYCIVVVGGSLVNSAGTKNPAASIVFTTDTSVSKDVEITPENKETAVSTATDVVITFDSKIYRYGGGTVTKTYAAENMELRKNSSSGTLVERTVEISSDGKTFTITPKEALAVNTTYYVRIPASKFQYADDTKVASKTSYFKTSDGSPTLSSVTVDEVLSSSAVFTVTSDVSGMLYAKTTGTDAEIAIVSGKAKQITLSGLTPKTSYSVELYVISDDGVKSAVKTQKITTTIPYEVTFTSTTDNSVSFNVAAKDSGKLTVTYTDKETGETKYKATGIVLSKGTTKSLTISNLTPDRQYDIKTSMTMESDDGDGVTYDVTNSILTEKGTNYLEISKLQIIDSDDNVYEADIDGTKATAYIGSTDFVNVKVIVPGSATIIKINGRETANSNYSSNITISGTTKEIPIELTYNGTTVKYTLVINIA